MISSLIILAYFLGSFYVLWVLFLAVMALKSAKDAGTLAPDSDAYYLGMSVLLIGYIVDFICNILASAIFLEPPFELTVTARVSRWKNSPGVRGDIARWMCAKILDPFQLGGHCN